MREKQIEQKLVQAVRKIDGMCLKFVSPNFDGMPDRLILLPGGKIAFAELKSPGKKATSPANRKAQSIDETWLPGVCH